MMDRERVSLELGAYDRSRPLIIDPALGYSTYLGGSSYDQGNANAIVVDSAGEAYVAGTTQSADFPVSKGAFQATLGATNDAFVTKLNVSGSAVVYSTYLGGSGNDSAQSIWSEPLE